MDDPAFALDLVECLEDAAYCVDKTRRILAWNGAAERLTGYTAAEAVGSRCWHNLLRHVDDQGRQLCRGWCPLVATMQDGQSREARVYLHHREGHRVPVDVNVRPLRTPDGTIIGGIETFTLADESEDALAHAHADRAGQLDRLVGIVDIGEMLALAAGWIEAMGRGGSPFGAVRLRIDARERVGAEFDLATCEAIIKAVGATLRHTTRACDAVARVGDQEFLILLSDCGEEEAFAHARRLSFLAEQTFLVRDRRLVRVNAETGVAVAVAEDTAELLLARAAVRAGACA